MRPEHLSRAGLLGCLILTGCREQPRAVRASEAPVVAVNAVASETIVWPTGTGAVGTVRARSSAVLASKVMGYVRDVRVHAGDRVSAGQVVAVLDAKDLDAAYRQAQAAHDESRDAQVEAAHAEAAAKANLDLAQATFRRIDDLFHNRSVSNQEHDEACARVKTAQAGYDMAASKRIQLASRIRQSEAGVHAAEVMRAYAEIRAPFAGTVTERRAEPGILATPGLPLLTIEQASGYRLEVAVEESLAGQVRLGERVDVSIESLDRSLEARVSEIVPAVDPNSRAFLVKIDLPAIKDLRSGLYGRARFATGSRPVVAVPAEAVRRTGQIESVMVAEGGIARTRLITTGEVQGSKVEVLTGLRAGEMVIPGDGVSDGSRVEAK